MVVAQRTFEMNTLRTASCSWQAAAQPACHAEQRSSSKATDQRTATINCRLINHPKLTAASYATALQPPSAATAAVEQGSRLCSGGRP